jgi:ketosteroid isomerase-like protein
MMSLLIPSEGCAVARDASDEDAILAEERRALDQWAQGNPLQYVQRWAEDVTYVDDIGAHRRLEGIVAVRRYAASLEGKVRPHRYELVDPRVQVYGDIGILTLRYEPFGGDGAPLQRWKATLVYRRAGGEWRVVHGHWSMVKES